MNKTMTLPDSLKQVSKKSIKTCYGYLLSDTRWLAGLPQFKPKNGVYIDRKINIDSNIMYNDSVESMFSRQDNCNKYAINEVTK